MRHFDIASVVRIAQAFWFMTRRRVSNPFNVTYLLLRIYPRHFACPEIYNMREVTMCFIGTFIGYTFSDSFQGWPGPTNSFI